ncbi:MAG: polysaccharide pyruvyl transferase family protein, partial [Paraclostridium sp.]
SIMGISNLLNKPVFIYAQGVGPIHRNINKNIVKYFLNKVQYISLRDEESFELVKSIGVATISKVVPDPVMGLDLKNIIIKNKGYDYIVVSVRDWNTKNNYLREISKACDNISKTGIGIKLLPMHGKLDEETSVKLANMMESKVEILSHNMDIENKLKYIKGAKLVIAMRLHALIFAGNVGTPMIGVSYDPKIESYLKLVKQPCIGNVNDKIDSEKLTKEAVYVIENYREEKSNLEDNTKSLRLTAKLTANKAVEIFKMYKGKGERHE